MCLIRVICYTLVYYTEFIIRIWHVVRLSVEEAENVMKKQPKEVTTGSPQTWAWGRASNSSL
jgi:hypothetical protein